MSTSKAGPNPILDSALTHEFAPFRNEEGLKRIVAFGENSHKCPTYINRVPPCSVSCPADEDIRGFHNILTGVEKTEDEWEAAWRRIVEKNPFPAIMGRVCPHPCETGCNRVKQDESVAINSVEHAIGDFGIEKDLQFHQPPPATGRQVAVIGGGPAGLSAAYQLAMMGHQATIFDYREKLGGMMRYGIMAYRVDRGVLDAEIGKILNLGVKTKMNTRIGGEITLEQLKEQYDAVYIGVGAQRGVNLPVPGFGDSPNTSNAIDFLGQFEEVGTDMHVGGNVVVVGDGDVSMDAARLALRLGASVRLLSAVPRPEMSCSAAEYEDSVREGTEIQEMISVIEVIRDGQQVTALKCVKMEKKEQGEDGFNSPVPFLRYKPLAGSEFEMECDMIVSAIGQATDMKGLEAATNESPWLNVDADFRVKGEENVFGGGDALKIDLITTAVGQGRKAAEAMDYYFKGASVPSAKYKEVIPYEKLYTYYFKESAQQNRPHHEFQTIKNDFDETLKSLGREAIVEESKRCMSCGMCFECKQCMIYCPQDAISYFKNNPIGEVMYTDYSKCVGCHICFEVCPTGYIHMGMGEGL